MLKEFLGWKIYQRQVQAYHRRVLKLTNALRKHAQSNKDHEKEYLGNWSMHTLFTLLTLSVITRWYIKQLKETTSSYKLLTSFLAVQWKWVYDVNKFTKN